MTTAIQVIEGREAFRAALDHARAQKRKVALVPTMGALHRGHLALMEEARRRVGETGLVAASIFVNPTQFGQNEDLDRYPRDLENDLAKCREVGVDLVFAPTVSEMYPEGAATRVRVSKLSETLCGEHRPVHFEGVATIVAKLFGLAGPCVAVFGKKDYQQLRLIERMAKDLNLPVEVVGHPTIRESDGLALSSRNAYLSVDERARALAIPRALDAAHRAFQEGERQAREIVETVRRMVEPASDSIDYISLADTESLEVFEESAILGERALLALAIRLGETRLIDSLVLGEDEPPRNPAQK